MITALGAEAVERAKYLALQADIISALTCEVLKGNVNQFDSDIHAARPHKVSSMKLIAYLNKYINPFSY